MFRPKFFGLPRVKRKTQGGFPRLQILANIFFLPCFPPFKECPRNIPRGFYTGAPFPLGKWGGNKGDPPQETSFRDFPAYYIPIFPLNCQSGNLTPFPLFPRRVLSAGPTRGFFHRRPIVSVVRNNKALGGCMRTTGITPIWGAYKARGEIPQAKRGEDTGNLNE